MQIVDRLAQWSRRLRPGHRFLDLRERTVLITGGSRGLGLEIARTFAGRGARVAVCGRDAAEVARAERDLAAHSAAVLGLVADVRSAQDIAHAVAATVERFGPIDILVNNAGIIQVAPLDALTRADYEDAMATHFWGPLDATLAVLPSMRARGRGRIVNVASIGGRISVPHLLPYSASKFALVGLSEGLRAELVREGIYVTTVIPGLMRTGSPENASFKGKHRAEYAWFSVSDSLPLISVDVTEAARTIVTAVEHGDAEVTISAPAVLGSIAHGVLPSAVVEALGLVARFLPRNGGIGSNARRGSESQSGAAPAFLTAATQRRAVTQNEVSPP
jgi:NAD(P)-dependent dehydrogenase (short-subunit alcohol dehydrogenase family)